jgi:hypothetical protein
VACHTEHDETDYTVLGVYTILASRKMHAVSASLGKTTSAWFECYRQMLTASSHIKGKPSHKIVSDGKYLKLALGGRTFAWHAS